MKMKPALVLISAAVLALTSCISHKRPIASSDGFPRLPWLKVEPEEELIAAFEKDPEKSQPWFAGDRSLPLSIQGLGLNGKVRLAKQGLYLDGGSQCYLLADEKDRLFAFCTSNPHSSASPAFLLGRMHFTEVGSVRVPLGSPSFQFLYRLVWSFSRDPRYQPDLEILRRVREELGLSEKEFAEMRKEPN